MLRQSEVTAEKVRHNGAWFIAALVDGYLKSRTYYGYPKREAIRLFVAEMNTSKAN